MARRPETSRHERRPSRADTRRVSETAANVTPSGLDRVTVPFARREEFGSAVVLIARCICWARDKSLPSHDHKKSGER